MEYLPNTMHAGRSYSRNWLLSRLRRENPEASEDALVYSLRKLLSEGKIIRIGWNQYACAQEKKIYQHDYSSEAVQVADFLYDNYTDLDFRLFELIQLNDFMNHLIAHNTIFVYVENDMLDFVFDSLIRKYPGRTMLKPKADDYFRYLQDNEIVVGRLPSESPKGLEKPWHSRLEKILVDISVDKLLTQIVPQGEYESIFQTAFEQFLLDKNTMIRYAKRRGAADKFESILNKYAPKRQDF